VIIEAMNIRFLTGIYTYAGLSRWAVSDTVEYRKIAIRSFSALQTIERVRSKISFSENYCIAMPKSDR
jgi:hypothetical protein